MDTRAVFRPHNWVSLLLALLVGAAMQTALAANPNQGFGKKVAGSYLLENIQVPMAGLFDLQAMATLGADGTAVGTDTDDFGLAQTAPHSPKQGAWKQTGKREIGIKVLEFAYTTDGVIHIGTWTIEFAARFDGKDFNQGDGQVVVKLFPVPYQEGGHPLDEDAKPVFEAKGTFDFRRIIP